MKRRVANPNVHQKASMAPGRPCKKLREAENTMGSSGSSVHRRRKTLSTLFGENPVVPFDVLLEILSQLDIKNLLNMSRANKDARRVLVSPQTVSLWRRKREETDAPPPPPGFSEAKWSSFLFTSYCYSCGVANSKVEPYLLKRICTNCRKKNYLEGWRLMIQDTNLDMEMLKHVPYTSNHWKPHAKGAKCYRFLLSEDLNMVESEWKRLETESKAGNPQSIAQFEAFKRELIQYNEQVHSSQKWQESGVIRRQIGELIKQRFYQLGTFMKFDIDKAVDLAPGIKTGNGVKLTDAAWLKYEQRLTPAIEYQRGRRYDRVREDRTSQMDSHLKLWKASLDVSTREFLAHPVLSELYHCQEVTNLRQLDCEIRLTDEEHYQPLIDAFPQLSADFIAGRKATLRGLVPISDLRHDSPDTLELATSTFRRGEGFASEQDWTFRPGDVIVGWNALSVCHFFQFKTKELLPCVFDPRISRISAGIIETCGLDPLTASVDDMDRLDERFVCICHLKTFAASKLEGSPFSFEAYTWRTALSHALVKHSHGSDEDQDVCFFPIGRLDIPLFRRLLDQREALNQHEDAGCVHVWICNHCFPARSDEPPRLLDRMLEHLRDSHGITEPVIQDDYFLNEHYRKWWERPCRVSIKDGAIELFEGVPPSGRFA